MIIVLLPVYNEEGNIGQLLERFTSLPFDESDYRILLVNDGSIDQSAQIVKSFEKRLPILLINHEKNSD